MKPSAIIFLIGILSFTSCGVKRISTQNREYEQTNPDVKPTSMMNEKRASHTSTLMPGGKVLIAGGFKKGADGYSQVYFNSCEIFDPGSGKFSETGSMNISRCGHTATLLPNGKVLVTGGWNENGENASTELYDPVTEKFTLSGDMISTRAGMTATLLSDGKVLIAGGWIRKDQPQLTAELFDPSTGKFTPAGNMITGRAGHTATMLNNGKILFTGGASELEKITQTAEIYDPENRSFQLTSPMNFPRYKHASILMSDGNVLVAGGSDNRDWKGKYSSAEIYDIKSGKFIQIDNMNRKI